MSENETFSACQVQNKTEVTLDDVQDEKEKVEENEEDKEEDNKSEKGPCSIGKANEEESKESNETNMSENETLFEGQDEGKTEVFVDNVQDENKEVKEHEENKK